MRKLRIAVWHNLWSGGGKRALYSHVKGLRERGHYIESWCPDTASQTFLPLNELVKEHILPLKGPKPRHAIARPFHEARNLLANFEDHCQSCAKQIGAGSFDVLYANPCMFLRTTAIAKYVSLPSALYLQEPFRWFYEAMPELAWISPFTFENYSLRALKRYCSNLLKVSGIRAQASAELDYARAFKQILVNSIYSRETILRTYNLESTVCYLGIDTDRYRPTGETKETYVVGLGTLYHGKGVDRAIRAIATIAHAKRPKLIWIGNGIIGLSEYEQLARKLRVAFVAKINISDDEVVRLLSKAAAMIYTSRLEPFGLAPLEANACGTPVVGIAEGGVKETIIDGVNGFLVYEDDPEMLGCNLERLVSSPELARELGVKAREHVIAHWNLEKATDAIELKLTRLVGQGPQVRIQ